MQWLDRLSENSARALAQRTSRRSLLGGLGALLLGGTAFPLLPVARAQESAPDANPKDKNGKPAPAEGANAAAGVDGATPSQDPGSATECEYWRHCAIGGFLCSCCGGSHTTCPPGTEMSTVTWVGTCHNPGDGKDYVISYNDCCGKSPCGRCECHRGERTTPMYQPYQSNDYNWCSASSKSNIRYHCSTARIVGLAK